MGKKKIILFLFILLQINFIAMAQEERTEILSEQEMNYQVKKGEYVKRVTTYSPVIIDPFHMTKEEFQERNIEFVMVYSLVKKTKISLTGVVVTAYFSKDGDRYKIYESEYLDSYSYRESRIHPWQHMSTQAKLNESEYVGNSDNEELLTVKIWRQIK